MHFENIIELHQFSYLSPTDLNLNFPQFHFSLPLNLSDRKGRLKRDSSVRSQQENKKVFHSWPVCSRRLQRWPAFQSSAQKSALLKRKKFTYCRKRLNIIHLVWYLWVLWESLWLCAVSQAGSMCSFRYLPAKLCNVFCINTCIAVQLIIWTCLQVSTGLSINLYTVEQLYSYPGVQINRSKNKDVTFFKCSVWQ